MEQGDIVAGLDLGSTKTCALIAEVSGAGKLKIIGVGASPSEGVRRGVVVDVEKTVQAVEKAVREAELMAGAHIRAVCVGLGGEHIASLNSRGVVAVEDPGREIDAGDRARAVAAARAVPIPFDREVLHVIAQEFVVDAQPGIRDPVGMLGARLETSVHIVTGAVNAVQNICKSVQRTGIEVDEMALEVLASARAVLEEDEKEMGVCMLDVGGGTTDLALFFQGSVRHTAVIGLGGQHLTSDVALCLRTSWPHAEELKCGCGAACADEVEEEEMIEVPGVAGRPPQPLARRVLAAIIEARMEEIFSLVRRQIEAAEDAGALNAGVVLTGGGALLAGVLTRAERSFGLPVRLGAPRAFEGMAEKISSPIYATALGLAMLGAESVEPVGTRAAGRSRGGEGRFESVIGRMREWF